MAELLDRSIDAVRRAAADHVASDSSPASPAQVSSSSLVSEAAALEVTYRSLLAHSFKATGERDRLKVEAEASDARLIEVLKHQEQAEKDHGNHLDQVRIPSH